MIENNEH